MMTYLSGIAAYWNWEIGHVLFDEVDVVFIMLLPLVVSIFINWTSAKGGQG